MGTESGKLVFTIEVDSASGQANISATDKQLSKLTDNATQSTAKMSTGFAATWTSMAAGVVVGGLLTAGINKVSGAFRESIKEAMEAEQVQSKLNSTLRANGESAQVMGGIYDQFAAQMQAMTGITDEEVKSLVTLAYNMKLTGESATKAVQGSIGLTTLYGGSMQGNLEAVARAYQGNWRQAEMLIPELKTLSSESEKLTVLQKKMADGFIASTDAMKGQAGALITAKNQWGDFKEAAGGALLTVFSGLKSVADGLTGHSAMLKRLKAEQEAWNSAMEAAKPPGWVSSADLYADDLRKDAEMAKILEDFKKTKAEIAEINRKDEAEQQSKAEEEALRKLNEEKQKALEFTEKYGSATRGSTEASREFVFQWYQAIGVLPVFNDAAQRAAEEQEALAKRTLELVDAEGELTAAGEGVYIAMLQWSGLLPQLSDDTKDNSDKTEKWTLDWKNANEVLEFAAQCIAQVSSLLGALGIDLGQTGQGLLDAAEGAVSFGEGLLSGNPLTVFSGALKIATGLIKAFSGDGIGEAIKRENEWMKLNKQLEQQLRDLAKEMGSTHAATSQMFDQIIEQSEVTVYNFDVWAVRLREILSDLDSGKMSLTETKTEIGDAFNSLIAKARQLGTEGSATLLTFFDDLASRGIEVAEVTAYMNEQLRAGLEGYKKYLTGGFSTATIGVFESILAYEKKIGENQELIDGVHGITQALAGLSNTTRLTEEEFDNFELAASDAFSKLTAQGFSSREALTELAPMLARLQFLHEEYGLTIDDATQALLDQANAENINLENYKSQEEIFGDMSASLKELVDIFRNIFPAAINQTTDAFKGLNREADGFSGHTFNPGGYNQRPDFGAASGFYSPKLSRDTVIQAHRGEEVSIAPAGQASGSRRTEISININGVVSPTLVAEAVLDAWRGNVRGMRSTLEGGN